MYSVMLDSETIERTIVWLGEGNCGDCTLLGGKAASLCKLAGDYRVPPGFSLTASAYDRAVAAGLASDGGPDGVALPSDLYEDLSRAYRELGRRSGVETPSVAVRSSALDEDGLGASFAGQHETFLNVVGASAVAQAVVRCWSSALSARALEYRRRQELGREHIRIAVLVQLMVPADVSAVVFSANPVTGSRGEVVVNASWGLGESIVGGTVTPDSYVLRKVDMDLIERRIADKRRMTVLAPEGTREAEVPRFLRTQPALAEDQAREMARLAVDLEERMGHPVDVECALHAGRLYLLQSRPITTVAAPGRPVGAAVVAF
jgi:phosphoenolpyruvate synthase/pyruvate phosphate dikinase